MPPESWCGIFVDRLLRLRQSNPSQHVDGHLARGLFALVLMVGHCFSDLIADGVDRIERRHRLLKDHGDLGAADVADLPPILVTLGNVDDLRPLTGTVFAGLDLMVEDLSPGDFARRTDQTQYRESGHGFAAAAFTQHAQRAPAVDVKADIVDRTHDTFIQEEIGLQILYFQKPLSFIHAQSNPT